MRPLEIPNNRLFSAHIKYVLVGMGNELLINEYKGILNFSSISKDSGIISWYRSDVLDKETALYPISLNLKEELWIGTRRGELHYFKFPKKGIKQTLPDYQFRGITKVKDETYLLGTENTVGNF